MKPRAATLDPATLRALANELDAERERAEGFYDQLAADERAGRPHAATLRAGWRDVANLCARLVRTYRNRATRATRARAAERAALGSDE